MTVLAETESAAQVIITEPESLAEQPELDKQSPEETLKDGLERIEETLPLEPLEGENSLNGITAVYWNPGGSLPGELLATASNATDEDKAAEVPAAEAGGVITVATSSDADGESRDKIAAGNDRADGYSPKHPVKTLETALKQADKLAEENGLDKSDIVIYAMNPMEVSDGRMYVLNAGNIRIASWPERTYHNDTIFYLNGGQLTLMNAALEAGDGSTDPDEAELIRVSGGTLQLGQNVQIDGRMVMDYRKKKGQTEWEKASASNAAAINGATASNADGDYADASEKNKKASSSNWTEAGETGAGFDINEYILSTDENEWELLEDKSQASTWREPIIELIEGFNGAEGEYLLELRSDDDKNRVTLARTLYADDTAPEEFALYFRLADAIADEWDLTPLSEQKAIVYDTGAEDMRRYLRSTAPLTLDTDDTIGESKAAETEEAVMTVKTLMGARAVNSNVVYWNPGGNISVGGITYLAGSDTYGGTEVAPYKTLKYAMERANGGTIICMQTVDLSKDNSGEYLPEAREGDSWIIKGDSSVVIPSLQVWNVQPSPIFRVPEGEKLILEDIMIEGPARDGKGESQAIVVDGGDVTIRSNVTAQSGYIQLNGNNKDVLTAHPVHADSTDGVVVNLFFSGINNSLDCNYVDVVVPTQELRDAATSMEDLGKALLDCYGLVSYHDSIEGGGTSRFGWSLRQDQEADDLQYNPQNLELYAEYYYDAIYLDGGRGNDKSLGATCESPVETFEKAKEIWEREMKKSLGARKAAKDSGMDSDKIAATYPYPSRIYICGPVQVSSSTTWSLTTSLKDYDGSSVSAEVQSHWRDIPLKGDGTRLHEFPKTMIEVPAGIKLRLENIVIRNDSDGDGSQTILVGGADAVLELGMNTTLKGNRDKMGTIVAKEATIGIHIKAVNGATVKLTNEENIFIEKRLYGISANGAGTRVQMDGGSIRNNLVPFSDAGVVTLDARGCGVYLSKGASMNMTGGLITGNRASRSGAGVYMIDTGTTFTMTGGSIEKNDVLNTGELYGIGIYAGTGTICNIGTDSGNPKDVTIKENRGQETTYGVGVYSDGTLNIKKAQISDNIVSSYSYSGRIGAYGVGVYVGNNGKLYMDGAEITGNKVKRSNTYYGREYGYGAGIYIASGQPGNNITNSTISGNMIGYAENLYASPDGSESGALGKYSYGGGIVYQPNERNKKSSGLEISHTTVSGNRALTGAGIQVIITSIGWAYTTTFKVTDCRIQDNICSGDEVSVTDPAVSGKGGGINITSFDSNNLLKTTIVDSQITGNQAEIGGGMAVFGLNPVRLSGSSTKVMEIAGNQGGGIYSGISNRDMRTPTISGDYVRLQGNIKGSGIYAEYGDIYLQDSRIIGNQSDNLGGGITIGQGNATLSNVKVEDNQSKNGGGVYLYRNAGLYWSEEQPGGSSLKGNTAEIHGGGLYVNDSASVSDASGKGDKILDFDGEIQNRAGKQGSNFYLESGTILTKGTLKQPTDPVNGVYNVYLNVGTLDSHGLSIDPTKVTIEKKTGTDPDAVYLNTGNSAIRYYQAPVSEASGNLPVDLNPDVFKIGSIVIKPADVTSVSSRKPNTNSGAYTSYTINFPAALQDASVNIGYASGGRLPRRTQLGGYSDPQSSYLTNVVLIGEGVYLSGNGNDSNDGSSPEKAVATFARAKDLLEKRIIERKTQVNANEGYAPYIYICGSVSVKNEDRWELDDRDTLFTVDNASYIAYERQQNPDLPADSDQLKAQIRRFASFLTTPMVTVDKGASLQMDRIIVNGMMESVQTSVQSTKSPLIKTYGTVTLNGDARLQNNWKIGVAVEDSGLLILDGSETQENQQLKDIAGNAVELNTDASSKGDMLVMRGYSGIRRGTQTLEAAPNGVHVKGSNIGTDARIRMLDHSFIGAPGDDPISWGIYINLPQNTNMTIAMEDNAKIGNTRQAIYTTGRGNVKISMNCNPDAKEADSAKIEPISTGYGIQVQNSDTEIYMGKQAEIAGGTRGVYYDNTSSLGLGKIGLEMSDNSVIRRCSDAGVAIFSLSVPVTIHMKNQARIVRNGYGIQNKAASGLDRTMAVPFTIKMEGDARISANSKAGVAVGTTYLGSVSGNERNLVLMDHAMIGGEKPYTTDVLDESCGNKESGIDIGIFFNVEMKGNAKVCYNNTGIVFNPFTSTNPDGNIAVLSVQDNAEIMYNSHHGISLHAKNSKAIVKGNAQVAENNTIDEAGNYEINSGNRDSSNELHLEGNAVVRQSAGSVSSNPAIYMMGKMFLSGTASVDGQIKLDSVDNPITLTAPVTIGKEYHLYLAEAFISKQVVIPDGTGVTDATPYLINFVKDGASGLANEKHLAALQPDIILSGENNVYLSGLGSDANDGMSPSTAVRTFARARELLRTGMYTEGANILICREAVGVLYYDMDWSFDPGGTVTNAVTHETWKPLVMRYKDYKGTMIIQNRGVNKLVLKDITLDGNKDFVSQTTGPMIEAYSDLTLGEGAVLQNGKIVGTYAPRNAAGLRMKDGTLNIEGGVIQGMESGYDSEVLLGSAVYIESGTMNFKSGQIRNNAVRGRVWGALNGAAVVIQGRLNMTGGSISGNVNENTSTTSSGGNGSALYVYNGRAEIKGGSIRDNIGAMGSAIYYVDEYNNANYKALKANRGVILSGGLIEGNRVNDKVNGSAIDGYAPVYVSGGNFQLEGGACDLKDSIYLSKVECPIYVSGDIYQTGRQYQVYLNMTDLFDTDTSKYRKGSVVVAPDGDKKQDVSNYLSYFQVIGKPKTVGGTFVLDQGRLDKPIEGGDGIKESQCLLLMKAIFINGDNAEVPYMQGDTPGRAVGTFSEAKMQSHLYNAEGLENYYILYVCGPVSNMETETSWELPAPAYMCRYTGFPIYDRDGNPVKEDNRIYNGYLITPETDLTVKELAIYGRRSIDSISENGNSLIKIPDGVTMTVEAAEDGRESVFGRNYNVGQYISDDGRLDTVNQQGGAFCVEPGGMLVLNSGRILETEAPFGSAIYLGADKADPTKTGHLILSGKPSVSGTVYLDGESNITAAYVEPRMDYVPDQKLKLAIGNDYNHRACVRYPEGSRPGASELEHFSFEDSIQGLYDLDYRKAPEEHVLELNQKSTIYLDGVNGSDDTGDGLTPETAFKTVKKVYQYVNSKQAEGTWSAGGILVYVVDTVTFDAGSKNPVMNNVQIVDASTKEKYYMGFYKDDGTSQIPVRGLVYFKRYVQPIGYSQSDASYNGYDRPTLQKALFHVEADQKVSLWGMFLDGHSQPSISMNKLYNTEGTVAMAPLVTVNGVLDCKIGERMQDSIVTSTVFLNNVNNNKKSEIVGNMGNEPDGAVCYEGSAAGVELLEDGSCELETVEFRNLRLGPDVEVGATDIYHNGSELKFSYSTIFGGNVFLEGLGVSGNEESHKTSRYLTVGAYGQPMKADFQVLMRDPYNNRKVVEYPAATDNTEGIHRFPNEVGAYRLEERVRDFFSLSIVDKIYLRLSVPVAIYVDGQNGDDNLMDRKAGSAPQFAVQTLKRAYELMDTRGSDTIIVVNTVDVDVNCTITGMQYKDGSGTTNLIRSDKVHIARYIQPDFARNWTGTEEELNERGFNKEDFSDGPLFRIPDGKQLIVGDGVDLDGHSAEKVHEDYPEELTVSRTSQSTAPVLKVDKGGTLLLNPGSEVHHNNNMYDISKGEKGMDGGAVYNEGTVIVNEAQFTENYAGRGSAAYQSGEFRIFSGVAGLKDHSFYLASENEGTVDAPVWGEDHVLQIGEKIPDSQIFDLDMDHAVAGRDVIRFIDSTAYAPESGADAEYRHFNLGTTVPDDLFLVESEEYPAVLELQDWKILHAEVPANIYLAMTRSGDNGNSTALQAVREGASAVFSSPQYQIVNNGRYDMQVSIVGLDNQNDSAGIPSVIEKMTLKNSKAALTGDTDLYLGIKGQDSDPADGFTETEIPLTEGSASATLGQLKAGSTGTFGLTGAVGPGFVDKYKDLSFPVTGNPEDVQKYMDGGGGIPRAKAKYLLKYKVEMVMPRR